MRLSFLFLVTLFCGQALAANDDAFALLERMSDAIEDRNYEGTFVYVSGPRMETMEIAHGADGDVRREHLLSLTGERREIIRDENEIICIWPDSKSMSIEPRRGRHGLPAALPTGAAERISESYSLRFEKDNHRVAGLSCRELVLVPIDVYRYGHRFCVENGTGLPLRAEMFDPESGQVVEHFMFTSIRFPEEIPAERFQPLTGGEGFKVLRLGKHPTREKIDPDMRWQFQAPPGFVMTRAAKRRMLPGHAPVQHMVVSDGLASVSVFIAGSDAGRPPHPLPENGPMHSANLRHDDWDITVVGEVPAITIRYIAESIRYGEMP